MAPKLILTGFMGTGKSAVAPLVARRLGWRLIDNDQALAARAGKPIAAIFAEDGEAHFRRLERESVAELARAVPRCAQCKAPRPAVIATGGGALVDDRNRRLLGAAGVIICLVARPEVIAERVRKSPQTRPKLAEGAQALEERIAGLLAERAGAYARAHATVDTSDLTIEEAAERVLAAFIEHGARRCEPSA